VNKDDDDDDDDKRCSFWCQYHADKVINRTYINLCKRRFTLLISVIV